MNDNDGRLANCRNKSQGPYPRVLCVCSAGMLRSPTLAWVLSNPPYNCNVRAAGINPNYALVPVDEVLIYWADHIVVVDKGEARDVMDFLKFNGLQQFHTKIVELQIYDGFMFRAPALVKMIQSQLESQGFPHYEPTTR